MKKLFFLILFFSINILTFGANVYFLNGGAGYIYTNGQSFPINQDGYAPVAYWIWADPNKYTYDHCGATFQDPDGNWSDWSDLSGGQGLHYCLSPGTWHVKGRVHVVADIYGYTDYWMYTSFTLYFYALAPPPPLSAFMSGPDYLAKGEIGTWTVTASGGTLPYSYKWSYYVYCSDIALAKSQSNGSGDVIPNALPCGYWVPVNNNTTNTLTRSSDGRAFQLKCIVTDAVSKTYTVTKDVSGSSSGGGGGDLLPKQQSLEVVKEFKTDLLDNYPNPFNPSTKINYSLKT